MPSKGCGVVFMGITSISGLSTLIPSTPAGTSGEVSEQPGAQKAVADASRPVSSTGREELTNEEKQEVTELKARDAEVRAHEAAHASAGGQYAGGATFEFQTGPDGRRYAVGGEVSIDTSAVRGDPEATIRKMQVVRKAALAPASPSSQDRSVAAAAAQTEAQARMELQKEKAGAPDTAGAGGKPQPVDASPQNTGKNVCTREGISLVQSASRISLVNLIA